jgi:tetratricopeptide (TPR) repeat protein
MQKATSFLARLNRAYAYAVLRALAVSLLFSTPLMTRSADRAPAILYKIFIDPDYEKWQKTGEPVGLIMPRLVPLKPDITEQQLLQFLEADSGDKSSLPYYGSLADLGNFYYQNGRIRDFIETSRLALDVLVNRFTKDHWVQLLVLVPLAETYANQGEYQEALPLFRRALTLYIKTEGDSTEHVAFTKHNIALSLKNLKQNDDEAEQHFQQSIAIMEALTLPRSNALPDFLDGYAIFLAERRHDYHRAYDTALKALALTRALPNSTPKQIAERMHNVGHILVLQNRMVEALEYTQEVEQLDSGEEKTAEGSAGKLNDLSLMYKGAGQLDKALATAKEALEKMEQATGPDSRPTAVVLNTLADIYDALGLSNEASMAMDRSFGIRMSKFGAESSEVAEALTNRGLVKYKRDLTGAIADLEQSLTIFEKQANPDEQKLASVNLNLAMLYFMQAWSSGMKVASGDRMQRAGKAAQRSVNWRRRFLSPGDKDLRSSQIILGMTLFQADDAKNGLVAFQDSLEGAGAVPNDGYLTSLAELMLSIGYAHLNQDDLSILWGKEAVNTMQGERANAEALHPVLRESLEERSHMVFEVVATLLVRQGRIAEAQQVLQMLKEHELYESFRGTDDDPRQMRAELTGLERKKFSRFYELRDQQIELASKRRGFDTKRAKGEPITSPEDVRQYKEIVARQAIIADAMRQFVKQLETDLAATPARAVQNSVSATAETTHLAKSINELALSEPTRRAAYCATATH